MTRRTVQEPTLDAHGYDVHPAFGLLGASLIQWSGEGTVLFDSDVTHRDTVRIRLMSAARKRTGSHDYVHGSRQLFELELSQAQWAAFVSTMNSGDGVPVTIRATPSDMRVPEIPYAPRLALTMKETKDAAEHMFSKVKEAFAKVKEKPTKANLHELEVAIENSTPNVTYATKTLSEHSEAVVQKARADVEVMVARHAAQLGIEAPVTLPPLLEGEVT